MASKLADLFAREGAASGADGAPAAAAGGEQQRASVGSAVARPQRTTVSAPRVAPPTLDVTDIIIKDMETVVEIASLTGNKEFVVFNIWCSCAGGKFIRVKRRYTDFHQFERELQSELGANIAAFNLPALPPKRLFTSTDVNSNFLQVRRLNLEIFLQSLLGQNVADYSLCFQRFLFEATYSPGHAAAGRAREADAPDRFEVPETPLASDAEEASRAQFAKGAPSLDDAERLKYAVKRGLAESATWEDIEEYDMQQRALRAADAEHNLEEEEEERKRGRALLEKEARRITLRDARRADLEAEKQRQHDRIRRNQERKKAEERRKRDAAKDKERSDDARFTDPSNWAKAFDAARKRTYYYHRETKEVRWSKPQLERTTAEAHGEEKLYDARVERPKQTTSRGTEHRSRHSKPHRGEESEAAVRRTQRPKKSSKDRSLDEADKSRQEADAAKLKKDRAAEDALKQKEQAVQKALKQKHAGDKARRQKEKARAASKAANAAKAAEAAKSAAQAEHEEREAASQKRGAARERQEAQRAKESQAAKAHVDPNSDWQRLRALGPAHVREAMELSSAVVGELLTGQLVDVLLTAPFEGHLRAHIAFSRPDLSTARGWTSIYTPKRQVLEEVGANVGATDLRKQRPRHRSRTPSMVSDAQARRRARKSNKASKEKSRSKSKREKDPKERKSKSKGGGCSKRSPEKEQRSSAPAVAAKAAASSPGDWVEAYDKARWRVYYYNRTTRVVRWTKPDEAAGASDKPKKSHSSDERESRKKQESTPRSKRSHAHSDEQHTRVAKQDAEKARRNEIAKQREAETRRVEEESRREEQRLRERKAAEQQRKQAELQAKQQKLQRKAYKQRQAGQQAKQRQHAEQQQQEQAKTLRQRADEAAEKEERRRGAEERQQQEQWQEKQRLKRDEDARVREQRRQEDLRRKKQAKQAQPSAAQRTKRDQQREQAAAGEWTTHTTAEGAVYFHNARTGETTWTNPYEDDDPEVARRQRERLQKHLQREKDQKAEDAQRRAVESRIDAAVSKWCHGTTGQPKSLRLLLATLPEIWPAASAAGIPIDLWKSDKYNAGQVKKAFFKAVRLVHPDKIASDATLEQKVKATKIFSELSLAQASS